jgi:hypothetical protein
VIVIECHRAAIDPLEIIFAREVLRTTVVALVWIWYRLVRRRPARRAASRGSITRARADTGSILTTFF